MIKIFRHLPYLLIPAALVIGGWMWLNQPDEVHTAWRTAKVKRGDMAVVVNAVGTLNPIEVVNVGTQVSGQISDVYVRLNDKVKKGQLLAELDSSVLAAQLKESQAALENARLTFEQAERDLKRTQMLLAKEYVAKIELEHAEQAYLSARNNYEAAKTHVERDEVNLNYARILSPIDGIVLSKEVSRGQTVAATFETPKLFTIAGDMSHMKIDVIFSEADIVHIKPDMPVSFTVDAFRDRQFRGHVGTVNLNGGNHSGYQATIIVDNPELLLLPGMTAYVNVILNERKDVLHVPGAALRFTPSMAAKDSDGLHSLLSQLGLRNEEQTDDSGANDGKTLYILRGGKLTPVPVRLGGMDETDVEIAGGDIHEGDDVVIGVAPRER